MNMYCNELRMFRKILYVFQLYRVIIIVLQEVNNKSERTQNKGKLLLKIDEIFGGKAHTNIWKLIWNILMVTDVFLNQERVNACEHTTKMVSLESFCPIDAIFVVCSHTFTLFWMRKMAVIIQIFWLSLRVPVLWWSLQFLVRVYTFLSLIFCYTIN